jgi:hypothetical protein
VSSLNGGPVVGALQKSSMQELGSQWSCRARFEPKKGFEPNKALSGTYLSGLKIGGECALYMMHKRWKCLPDRAFPQVFWQMSKP